jgi:hypothetical protein
MKNVVFWDVAQCRSCVNRRFGGKYRFHLQGREIRERGTSVSRWLQLHLPWRWKRYFPPKRRLTQDLHSATSQKTTFFWLNYSQRAWGPPSLGADPTENAVFLLFRACSFSREHVYPPLPRNGRLLICLLHSKDCTCYNIITTYFLVATTEQWTATTLFR